MSLEKEVKERANGICELCGSSEELTVFIVAPKSGENLDEVIATCKTCTEQLEDSEKVDANHWRCLNDSMWSAVPAVQVVAWRMLNQLKSEGWPVDLLDMIYLDEETLAWAKEGQILDDEAQIVHKDSNGALLQNGDTVTLIKDLEVKGANFTAKRGTAVRNINLVHDNSEHIEGKVEGQKIVILTKFVKKN